MRLRLPLLLFLPRSPAARAAYGPLHQWEPTVSPPGGLWVDAWKWGGYTGPRSTPEPPATSATPASVPAAQLFQAHHVTESKFPGPAELWSKY